MPKADSSDPIVRQSFSHGRSKAVFVQIKPITRREPPSAGPVAQPLPPKPRPPLPAMAELDFRHDLDESK